MEFAHPLLRCRKAKALAILFLACAADLAATPVFSSTISYTVQVAGDAGCTANPGVAAIVLGPNGPDPFNTAVAQANGAGLATFNNLYSTYTYQFIAVNAHCTPSARDQFMDPTNSPAFLVSGGTKTITLTGGASDATVIMNVKVPAGGFPKLVMGGCNVANNNVQAAYGISLFVAQTSTITFYNMRPAPLNTYNCGVYDAADNRSGGEPVNMALVGGAAPVTLGTTVDLTQTFAPPPSTENQASRDGNQTGQPSLTVFVSSGATTTQVSGAQLRLKNTPTGNPIFFTMTDPNGVGNFYGLLGNTSYYLDVIAAGYQGQMSLFFSTPSWSVTVSTNVQLGPLTNPGTISGTVKMNGATLPDVWVNCHPDFRPYPGADQFFGTMTPWPGAGDVGGNAGNGSFSFTNLVPGNYDCWVNSPFSSGGNEINAGPDGVINSTDDYRLTISTLGVFQVWTASGATPGTLVSSNTALTVNIPVNAAAANGTISGTLTFPDVAVLTSSPIVIMAFEQSVGFSTTPPHGGITVVNGTGQTQTYTLAVPAGFKYQVEVRGITYGPVNVNGQQTADLTGATSVTGMNFTMAKAGSVQATLIGPNGSRWLPTTGGNGFNQNTFCSAWVDAEGQSVRSWNGTQVDNTGVVTIAGLPAGTYNLRFMPQGNGCTVAPATLTNVVVGVGNTTNVTMNIQNGVAIDVSNGTLPPGITIPTFNGGGNFFDGALAGRVVGFARGTPLTLDLMRQMNGESGNALPVNLNLVKGVNQNAQLVNAWISRDSGGTPIQAPKIVPGDITFYLFAEQTPNWEGLSGTLGVYYDVLLGKVNAVATAANATTMSTVFISSVVPVAIPSSFGSATISGAVTGKHIFTKDDFISAAGDHSKTFSYIPVCAVYDGGGNLLGLSYAIPAWTPAQRLAINAAQQTGDVTTFLTLVNGSQMNYSVPLMPAGNLTLTCATPNYPPVVKSITLGANQTTTLNIDFDALAGAGGTISGTVTDANGTALPGATVSIRTKTINKTQTADAAGAYAFPNLADGIYRMEATNAGYASATDKVVVSNGSPATVNFKLVSAPGSITGNVYASGFPNKVLAAGAKVYAYDDTVNAARLSPDAPHWITKTDSNGNYTLLNPTPGDLIKIFAVTDGKIPTGMQVTATAGQVTAPDIILAAVPPTPTVLFRPRSSITIDLFIHAPKLLASNPLLKCSAGSTYVDASATDFSASITVALNNDYEAPGITLPASKSTCRVTTDDGLKLQTADTTIDLTSVKEQSNNAIRDEAFGGSAEGNSDSQGCAIDFPMGSIVTSSGTVPTAQMVRNSTGSVVLTGDTTQQIFSDSFQLQTDANLQLGNGKELDITLPMNKDKIPNIHSLRLAQLINGQAVPVPSEGYYDALTGRFTVSIKSLSNAPTAGTIRQASGSPLLPGLAPYVNGAYTFRPQAAGVQAGNFVLIGNLAGASGSPYAGASMNAYNFPNPFDLTDKSLTASNGGSVTSADGSAVATAIHYDLPAANAGHVIIRIFTISGELVRVLDQGIQTGGVTNYATWDGKNMNGAHVASGVYFGVFDVPGLTPKDHVIKMVVLK